jgi:hypothetical protein
VRINHLLLPLCGLALYINGAYAKIKGPNYYDIRTMGMGNTTVTVTTDRTSIFHNPAGLGLIKNEVQFSASPIAAAVDGIFITLLKEMNEQGHKLKNLAEVDQEFIDMLNEYDGQWVGLEYIPEFTVAAENIGFGIYSVFPIGVRVESGHLIPKLGLRGQRDLVFTWAVGVPLRHKNNYCGISVDYLQRTPLDMLTTYSETFILFDEITSNPFGVLGDFSSIQHGVSFDVGFIHDVKGFRFAYDIKDILGVIDGEIVAPPQVDLGCAYYFPQLEKVKTIENLIIAIEIANLFRIDDNDKFEHMAKKLHFGLELDMKYAALRGGISGGYPTGGMGIRLGAFKIDYAFFTEELGYYPGQLPKYKHIVAMGIEFKVETKPDKWDKIELERKYNVELEEKKSKGATGNKE